MFDVTVAGHHYQEMHVDGGRSHQSGFLFPPSLIQMLVASQVEERRDRVVYIIRNGRIDPLWEPVPRRSTTVAHHAIDALIDVQAVNDLYRLEVAADQNGERFNAAYIGRDFNYPHKALFSARYMRQLFLYSYNLAKDGIPWHGLVDTWSEDRLKSQPPAWPRQPCTDASARVLRHSPGLSPANLRNSLVKCA
jgi:hypothetical protein